MPPETMDVDKGGVLLLLVEDLSDYLEPLSQVIGLVEKTPGPDLDHDVRGGIRGKTAGNQYVYLSIHL